MSYREQYDYFRLAVEETLFATNGARIGVGMAHTAVAAQTAIPLVRAPGTTLSTMLRGELDLLAELFCDKFDDALQMDSHTLTTLEPEFSNMQRMRR